VLRAAAIVVALGALTRSAAAQDAFEIQVYDAETAPPADTGLEVHVNYVAAGSTVNSPEGERPSDHVTHLTLEPHVGLLRWCEAGAYFQTALRPDGALDFAGVKLRFKARLPRRLRGLVGLALNGELSSVPRTYEATGLGGELRPIVDVEWRRLYASLNPIIGFDFFGRDAGHPQLQPAATVLLRLVENWQIGVEYYGAFGPIDAPRPASEQVHRLFVVTSLQHRWFGLHVGGGYGFAAGDKWIVKSILSFDFNAPR
jgi:hypothetical protein